MENNVEVEYECYPTVNNNENIETFKNSNGEVYFPDVPEVLQANQKFLSKMVGIDNNLISDQLPKETSPTNNPQPNPTPMPVIKPNSLPKPVKIALPDGVAPTAPVLLLSRLPDDLQYETVTSLSPDNTPANNLDKNLKKSNQMSVENGLTPVPVVSAPSGKPVADQVNKVVVNAPGVSQQIAQYVAEPVSQPVAQPVVDQVNTVVDKVNTVVVNASSVSQPVSTKTLLKELTNQVATKPTTSNARIVELPPENEPAPAVLKIKKTHQRRLMKKVLMYIAIALVIYLIYLLFNENKK